jgi:hypothetical protein
MNNLTKICCYCGKKMGAVQVERPVEPGEATHVICEECFTREIQKARAGLLKHYGGEQ